MIIIDAIFENEMVLVAYKELDEYQPIASIECFNAWVENTQDIKHLQFEDEIDAGDGEYWKTKITDFQQLGWEFHNLKTVKEYIKCQN